MKVQKLSLDDTPPIDFQCFAIHTNLEDYQLAYLLNKHVNLKLKRTKEDLDIENGQFKFPLFEWEDLKNQNKWHLISNLIYKEVEDVPSQNKLFTENIYQIEKQYLFPEINKVNFILRICLYNNENQYSKFDKSLNLIPQITTSYQIDLNKIKHIEYLTLE